MDPNSVTNKIVAACFKATVFVLVSVAIKRIATDITDNVTILVKLGKKD